MTFADLTDEIRTLAADRHAVILAHNYQRPEVQDAADFVGDSLGLSRQAAETDADVIVFCRRALHGRDREDPRAGKDRRPARDARRLPDGRHDHRGEAACMEVSSTPGVPVVTYVNSSADVKALSDVCCTSANAPQVVRSLGAPRVLFAPDRNLAHWVATQVPDVEVVAWPGFCPTHERITAGQVRAAIDAHPGARVMAHPECRPEVLRIGRRGPVHERDAAVRGGDRGRGVHRRRPSRGSSTGCARRRPGKRFYTLDPEPVCPNMKLTTLAKVRDALAALAPTVEVPEDVRTAALCRRRAHDRDRLNQGCPTTNTSR